MPVRDSDHGSIRLRVIIGSQEYLVQTFPGEYRNLMMLIFDTLFPEDFGECKGIGRCGTCHVYIANVHSLDTRVGNEEATLSKMKLATPESRLSCQIPIDSRLHGITVQVVSEIQ